MTANCGTSELPVVGRDGVAAATAGSNGGAGGVGVGVGVAPGVRTTLVHASSHGPSGEGIREFTMSTPAWVVVMRTVNVIVSVSVREGISHSNRSSTRVTDPCVTTGSVTISA